jgi:predicted DNA repair protein MutK
MDNVALLSNVAAKKTASALGDDLALNAQHVSGVKVDRELPVVWAVAKGSFINKSISVSDALAIGTFAPWAVTPLLMVGGAFLCYEGFEKLAHRFMHSAAEREAQRKNLVLALTDPKVDLLALEKTKIKGAVRTDFILLAEIIAITLGTVQGSPFITKLTVLSGIAIVMTAGVYGLVAGIVKIDDAGLYLSERTGASAWERFQRSLGRGILCAAPWFLRGLSVAGTIAMFLVGGRILTHGLTPLHSLIDGVTCWASEVNGMGGLLGAITPLAMDGRIVAGALVLLLVNAVKRIKA